MKLDDVRSFRVPRELVEGAERALREAGRAGYERFALWSGNVMGDSFIAKTLLVPHQTAYKLERGVCVRVGGEELHRLNLWLYEHRETLAIQIHTHPSGAYHSETDDTYPIATQAGALSIVVPDFCRRGLFVNDTATYRLRRSGWDEMTPAQAQSLVTVID
ncbi:MAG TPA: hypothetical protein VII30_08905 [Gemmatimonadaceae bacterium]